MWVELTQAGVSEGMFPIITPGWCGMEDVFKVYKDSQAN